MADTLVYVVPGIMGSVLSRDGNLIWRDDFEHLLVCLLRHGDLAFSAADARRVRADRLMGPVNFTFVEFFPGYGQLLDRIQSHGYSAEDGTLVPWAYDWRRSISDLGLQLLNDILAQRTAVKARKVVIVAHSLGCLVARSALQIDGRNGETLSNQLTRLVEIAPPHGGSPGAVSALEGDPLEALGMFRYLSTFLLGRFDAPARLAYYQIRASLLRSVSSFNSVYELMPMADSRVVVGTPYGRDSTFTTRAWLAQSGRDGNLMTAMAKRDALAADEMRLARALNRLDRVVLEIKHSTAHTLRGRKTVFTRTWGLAGNARKGRGDRVVPAPSARRLGTGATLTVVTDEKQSHNSVPTCAQALDVVTRAVDWL